MAGANIGLSMLSRGIGEEKQIKGQRKLEVSLEPEDYHNIQSKKFFLPPIQQQAWPNGNIISREMMTHKTFTTRKGALLLYAEDLVSAGSGTGGAKKKALEAEDSSLFSSTNEFCSAILSYGAKESESSPIFLNFVKGRSKLEARRSVRPGFSAKRYMANWSRSWDDSVLNKLRSNGNIWDKNLFQPNAVNPSIYRRINDDLSQYPSPYHVTRSMLLSPGDLQPYEFYRIRTNISDEGISEETEEEIVANKEQTTSPTKGQLADTGAIVVVERDKDNKPHLISYRDLDEEKQTAVLQRLLVQSVLNHQQCTEELFQERMSSFSTKSESGSILEPPLNLDIEQAIVDLVTSNSSQLRSGNPVFTDVSFIRASPTQLKAQLEMRAPSHNSGRGQYITLPPISSPIPALRPLKKKPLGGVVLKLPPVPTKSEISGSGSHYRSELTQSDGGDSNSESDDSEQWQGNVTEEDMTSKEKLSKLGSLKSGSNNSQTKVPAADFGLTVKGRKNLHGSLESQAQASSDVGIGVKGGFIPKWQEKSMRSYKSSVKSSSGSVDMGPDGEMLVIGSSHVPSLAGTSEYGNDDAIENDVVPDQEDIQSKSASESIHVPGEGKDNKHPDTPESQEVSSVAPQNDATGSLHSQQIDDDAVAAQDKAPSGRQCLTAEDAVVVDGEQAVVAVQPEHAVTDTDGVLAKEQPESATTADGGDVQINQDDLGVKKSISEAVTSLPTELKEKDDGKPEEDNEGRDLASFGQPGDSKPEIPIVDIEGSSDVKQGEENLPPKEGVQEEEPSSKMAAEVDDTQQDEQDHEPEGNGSVVSAASVMEDIVEQALKVAELVIQRPKSGRDLAADAKAAAGMWAEQLKDLFRENHKKLERSASATFRKRRQSSTSASSTDSFGVGYWAKQSSKTKNTKKSKQRVHSAEAAISVIKNFMNQKQSNSLEGDEIANLITQVADTNDRIQTTPVLVQLIKDKKSLAADDIHVSEDAASGVFFISSRAPSRKSANESEDSRHMPHSFNIHVPSVKDTSNDVNNSTGDGAPSKKTGATEGANDGQRIEEPEETIEGSRGEDAIPKENNESVKLCRLSPTSEIKELKENDEISGDKMNIFSNNVEENKKEHIIDGSGDATSVKSSKKTPAQHSASARSTSSAKTTPQETSLEFDVTSYQGGKKEELKSNVAVKDEPIKSDSIKEVDDDTKAFQEAIDKIVQETGLLEKDKINQKQNKPKKQMPQSPASDKNGQTMEERDRFIVGLADDDKINTLLYKQPEKDPKTSEIKGKPKEPKKPEAPVPKKPKTKKTVKKEKKKVEKKVKGKKKSASDKDKIIDAVEKKETTPTKDVEEAPEGITDEVENAKSPPKEDEAAKETTPPSPDVMSIDQSASEKSSETPESPQFIIIHDQSTGIEVKSLTTVDDNYSDDVMSSITEDSTIQGPQSISRSQAKQAKRAAEAERRKQEVERKRRKREEAKRKSIEEAERREQLKQDFEEDRRRKEEEIRLRREREIEEKQKNEEALLEKKRQAELAIEREKKQKEERQKRMDEMARRKRAEELKRKEEEERKRKEEEEQRKAEEEMLSAMAEEERLEYEKRKREEELLQKEHAEQERLRREEAARIAKEEAERLMLLKLKEQKELEIRLQFNRVLHSESNIMAHSQEMTRAFTFSYYELLEALGIEPPEWLRNELQQFSEA